MKRLIILLVIAISFSCNTNITKEEHLETAITNELAETIPTTIGLEESPIFNFEPYEIDFKIDHIKDNEYVLSIFMNLNNGSHFVSPNATRDFSGKFTVIMDNKTNFSPIGKLIETPKTEEENDPHPYVNGAVNWVRENTVYKQHLILHSKDDFKIPGTVQFTIEPRCTLEKIPFIIRSENGEIKVSIAGC